MVFTSWLKRPYCGAMSGSSSHVACCVNLPVLRLNFRACMAVLPPQSVEGREMKFTAYSSSVSLPRTTYTP